MLQRGDLVPIVRHIMQDTRLPSLPFIHSLSIRYELRNDRRGRQSRTLEGLISSLVQLVKQTLQRTTTQVIRNHRDRFQDLRIQRNDYLSAIRGVLRIVNIDNVITGATLPIPSFTNLTPDQVLEKLEGIHQSNGEVDIFSLRFEFYLDPTSYRFGGAIVLLPPKLKNALLDKDRMFFEPETFVYESDKVNCAAFCLQYKLKEIL